MLHALTTTERVALNGAIAREELLQKEVSRANGDYAALVREIESRLNLAAGAIGSTHRLDTNGVTEPPAKPEVEPVPAG